MRLEFVNRVSGANLKSLLDHLLYEGVINDDEMESATEVKGRKDKARAIINMVRQKGDEASSKMIQFLKKDEAFRNLL